MSKKLNKNRKRLQQMGLSNVDICRLREMARKETNRMEKANEQATEEMRGEENEKAFLYMLAIPLNVLVDMWGEEEAKKKAPDFIDEVISLYEAVQNGYVSNEQLAELLEDMAWVKITSAWLKKGSSKDGTDEKGE